MSTSLKVISVINAMGNSGGGHIGRAMLNNDKDL